MAGRSIFVFGSNRQGIHGAGAALEAVRNHGAIYGQAAGFQGNSYAIITKELRSDHAPVYLGEIKGGVLSFRRFASKHLSWTFNVTAIGCGLAGFSPEEIAPFFIDAGPNVNLPMEFCDILVRLRARRAKEQKKRSS